MGRLTVVNHRKAALALLNTFPTLPHKEAGFLGHVCVAPELSDKQSAWLLKLVARHGIADALISDEKRIGGAA
jgi:hypothetical protein